MMIQAYVSSGLENVCAHVCVHKKTPEAVCTSLSMYIYEYVSMCVQLFACESVCAGVRFHSWLAFIDGN